MIAMMIDALVELVLVVMSVEVMEFDIDSKQQDRYVVVAGGRRRKERKCVSLLLKLD